jgi:hypothetical protein
MTHLAQITRYITLGLLGCAMPHYTVASVVPLFSNIHQDETRANQMRDLPDDVYISGRMYALPVTQAGSSVQKIENIDEILNNPDSPNLTEVETEAVEDAMTQIVESLLENDTNILLPAKPTVPQETVSTTEAELESNASVEIDSIQSLQALATAADWLAIQLSNRDPETAADAMLVSSSAARQAYQMNGLLGQLVGSSLESNSLETLAHVLPDMSPTQRHALIEQLQQLPPAVPLAATLQHEIERLQKLQSEINQAMTAHEQAHPPRDDVFPYNLRLAGILKMPNNAASISLHNLNTSETFWVEEGQTRHGISLETVNIHTQTATIREGQRSAAINLQNETIADRRVPWSVIYGIANLDTATMSADKLEQEKATLIKQGITPETLLDRIDAQQAFFTNLRQDIEHSDLPANTLLALHLEKMPENSEIKSEFSTVPYLNHKLSELALEQRAMDVGLHHLKTTEADLPTSNQISYMGSRFQITTADNGFVVSETDETTGRSKKWPILSFGNPTYEFIK